MTDFAGTAGNDTLVGTSLADAFDIGQGGSDTVRGGSGDDVIKAGAAFDALDRIDGQAGYDTLELAGNYAAGITLASLTLRNVEAVAFGAGFSYKLVLSNATVVPGAQLKIDGYAMSAGQSLYVDGSAESDGSFLIYDGLSNDTFTGGALSDTISVGSGGADTVHGGGGDDVIGVEGTFTNADIIDGGSGNDVLYLRGNYAAGLAIGATAMVNIENLGLIGDFAYVLSVSDGNVAAGRELYISAEGISGSGYVRFDGSAETDGTFSFRDSGGDDNLGGGTGDDIFRMTTGGNDAVRGDAGDDRFLMYDKLDDFDQIDGGNGHDMVFLDGDYSAGLRFEAFTIFNVEKLIVSAGHDYVLTSQDTNVGADTQLVVSAALGAGNKIVFDGSAETDGWFEFYGGQGNDTFFGGAGNDYLDASQGGNDRFLGGGGDDVVSFFGSYTANDFVDGGAGMDSVNIEGDFSAGLVLNSARFAHVDTLNLGGGFSYKLTAANSLLAAGETMSISGYFLAAGQSVIFDGSAETDGAFELRGGDGDDRLTGGSKADTFYQTRAGDDTMNGGNGDDVFYIASDFTAADKVNGGAGFDTVALGTQLAGGSTLGAQTLVGIEEIELFAFQGYSLTTHDGNVAANALLTVVGSYLTAEQVLDFNGSAETNGRFVILGGSAGDTLRSGAKNDQLTGDNGDDKLYGNAGVDTLIGGLGVDDLYGGAGNDKFVLTDAAQSTVAAGDTIRDWNAGDKIDLSAIDADSATAGDQAFTFIGAAAFSAAAQLQVTKSAGNTFVKGDIDGNGSADFVITLAGTQNLAAGAFFL